MKNIIGMPYMGSEPARKKQAEKYISTLERLGVDVKILPWTDDVRKIKWYVYQCDGFLIPEGPEISPEMIRLQKRGQGLFPLNETRGEEPSEEAVLKAPEDSGIGGEENASAGSEESNWRRDRFEYRLIQNILLTNKPILALGRGMNMLNLVQGGTLKSDDGGEDGISGGQVLDRIGTGLEKLVRNSGQVVRIRLIGHIFCIGLDRKRSGMGDQEMKQILTRFINSCPYSQAVMQRFSFYD